MPQTKSSTVLLGILEYRKRSGLSRERLSQLSGVGVSTLIRMERGVTKNPALHTLQRLAETLHGYVGIPEPTILEDLKDRHLGFQAPEHSLRYYRQLAGMTQEELADAVGVSVGTISTFERRLIDTMFLSTALKISRCLSERLSEESASDILFNIAVAAEAE